MCHPIQLVVIIGLVTLLLMHTVLQLEGIAHVAIRDVVQIIPVLAQADEVV